MDKGKYISDEVAFMVEPSLIFLVQEMILLIRHQYVIDSISCYHHDIDSALFMIIRLILINNQHRLLMIKICDVVENR